MVFRVGIDGYNFAMPHGTGIATYGLVLAQTLRTMGHRVDGVFGIDIGPKPETREVMFFDHLRGGPESTSTRRQFRRRQRMLTRRALAPFVARVPSEVPLTSRVEKDAFAESLPAFDRLFSLPHLFEIASRHFRLYGTALTIRLPDPPDIMHWTYPVPVRMKGARNVYTMHDLIPLKLPYTTLDSKRYYRSLLKGCIAAADRICTVSETSRTDIIAEFGIDPQRVVNTYQASPMRSIGAATLAEEDAAIVEGVFGLARRGYFLFFGAIEPKKNLGRLLEAYLGISSTTPLVIVGARAWQSEGELKLLANLEAVEGGRRVIRLEYLQRSLLTRLIRGAKAVCFPSLYEGFGLPLLEAMQLGTPVLSSNTGSLPEVGGDAVLYCDPYDPMSIAAGLRALDGDGGLRDRLSAAGIERAEAFSPARYAVRLSELYRGVTA